MRLIYKLLKQLRFGKPISFSNAEERTAEIIYFQSNHFSIKNPSHAVLHIDGEPMDTAGEFEIKIIEKAFRLLMP
jgi:diacylglycerol kinase family enzyme